MLLVLLLAAGLDTGKPRIEARATPQMQTLNLGRGCSPVLITAVLRGEETEEYYCPKVTWTRLNGTESVVESDCPPFEQRNQCYPPQGPECGVRGFYLSKTGEYIEKFKDCPCTVIGYARMWTLHTCAPEHPAGGYWAIRVRFEKNGKTLAQEEARFYVK